MTEKTLARARAGDGDAFRELVDPYRGELQAHCYRILGSVADAEDVLQEALLAAWRSIGRFDGLSLRAWLYRVATNRCLNYLRDASRRPQPAALPHRGAGWSGMVRSDEPWWLEPYPDALLDSAAAGPEARYDARESIALSFVAGLQHLPPQQRAVLVLRDVLGFPASEAAAILGTTAAAVNSALIRARAGIPPDRDPHDVPLPRSPAEAAVVRRFVDAFGRFDVDELVALLTQDARLAMPPEPFEFRGPPAIAGFLKESHFWGQEHKLVPTRANGQPALAFYLPDPSAPIWRVGSFLVLTLRGNQVSVMTRFGDRGLLARFGLPRTLPRDLASSAPICVNALARAEVWSVAYGGSMARVDPEDDSIRRFIVRHYRYDAEWRERRHVVVAAFDNEAEFQACMQDVAAEIRRRRGSGENVDRQEHASGGIREPGYLRRAAIGHLFSRAIRHGVSPSALQDLELPSNVTSIRAERDPDDR